MKEIARTSKKRKRSIPVSLKKHYKRMVINMNRANLKKFHEIPSFRTGGHKTVNAGW